MIIADTSGLLALFNQREPAHDDIRRIIGASNSDTGPSDTVCVSPYVIAELHYLVATRMGVAAELQVLDELSSGAYELASLDNTELRQCTKVIERYSDQEIGLADASIVVLAARYRTKRILTLDHRHFDVVRPLDGGRFRLLP